MFSQFISPLYLFLQMQGIAGHSMTVGSLPRGHYEPDSKSNLGREGGYPKADP